MSNERIYVRYFHDLARPFVTRVVEVYSIGDGFRVEVRDVVGPNVTQDRILVWKIATEQLARRNADGVARQLLEKGYKEM